MVVAVALAACGGQSPSAPDAVGAADTAGAAPDAAGSLVDVHNPAADVGWDVAVDADTALVDAGPAPAPPCLGPPTLDLALGGEATDQGFGLTTSGADVVLAGQSGSSPTLGKLDAWLLRLGPDGATEWGARFGTAEYDVAESVAARPDGALLVAGYQGSTGLGGASGWLAATDPGGDLVWELTLGEGQDAVLRHVRLLDDLDAVVVGGALDPASLDRDMLLARVSPFGELRWDVRHGSFGDEMGFDLAVRPGGGFAIVGTTTSNIGDGVDAKIWFVDTDGGVEAEVSLGGPGDDFARAVVSLPDDRVVVAGHRAEAPGAALDAWVSIVDSAGDVSAEVTLGGEGHDDARDLLAWPTGGYLLVANDGESPDNPGSSDAWLVFLDAGLQPVDEVRVGGPEHDVVHAATLLPGGGFATVGYTSSAGAGGFDLWHMRFAASCDP